MHSTLNPNQTDPRDVFVDAPDVAPHADPAFSGMAHDAMRLHSDPQAHMAYESSAGPSVPPVDTTFRATDVNRARVLGGRRPMGVRMMRGVIGFLLAVCVGVAGALWQSHGDVARDMIAKWVPQLVPASSPPPESPALADQSNPPAAVQASTETAAPPQPASLAQTTTTSDAVAPAAAAASPESAQLQSMAHDLAVAEQEIETLKATVAQLKANQEQISRDVAKVSVSDKPFEPNPRPRISAPLPRPAAAPARKPIPQVRSPRAAAAQILPQAAAPPVPRQVEPQPQAVQPQAAPQPQAEPQLSSVLRPPMPVP